MEFVQTNEQRLAPVPLSVLGPVCSQAKHDMYHFTYIVPFCVHHQSSLFTESIISRFHDPILLSTLRSTHAYFVFVQINPSGPGDIFSILFVLPTQLERSLLQNILFF